MKQFSLPKITFWRVLGILLIAAGIYSAVYRFVYGLGAATNLSDDVPWGLWIGFDVLSGVGLAGGGFVLCAIVYLFNIQRFKPIVRPAVLTAFLGYIFVNCALILDLGKPLHIWHAMVMWNPHSVLFEVAWCVMLYTTVLALEFSPVVLEKFKFTGLLKVVKAITLPLVLVGVLLSTLHQSSLGSLFLIVPNKLHPFWYSPMLPVFFFLSALAVGAGMTIVESFLSARAFQRALETPLLRELARLMVVVLLVYATAKILDFGHRGVLSMVFNGSLAATLLWIELGLFIVVPVIILSIPRLARNQVGLFVGAVSVVLGFVMNRLNVSVTGMEASLRTGYFPSLMELSITAGLVALGFWIFALAVKYFPVFAEPHDAAAVQIPPALTSTAAPNGIINWPLLLRGSHFAEHRARIEAPYRCSATGLSSPTAQDYEEMIRVTEQMKAVLKQISAQISARDYLNTEARLDQFAAKVRSRIAIHTPKATPTAPAASLAAN
ncbi:MAG: Ni/Fe-hydrogenase cytochrome b subunit [Planctomycetota bacterium]